MKNKIEINVEVTYLSDQSDILNNQYAYAYTITITNQGDTGAQLRTRRWLIQDESGETEEVIGEGVIGQQPHLSPGESFKYSSGAIISTETGTMKGSYGMISDIGQRFDADIPEFTLSEPRYAALESYMDYAIGDVQGCFNSLYALLKKINFNIDRDRLYFLGDVVNRGTHSLETLRFIFSNKDNVQMVIRKS